jgi:hypothetical protein
MSTQTVTQIGGINLGAVDEDVGRPVVDSPLAPEWLPP